jgi:hypothetical protein
MRRYSTILQQPTTDQTLISYYKNPFYQSIPISTNDIYVITTSGDRLDLLSTRFYNSSQYYWVIALANPNKTNPGSLFITPGTQIRIPANLEGILSVFTANNS